MERVRLNPLHFVQKPNRLKRVPHLCFDDTGNHQCLHVIGLDRQNLAAKATCFSKLVGSMSGTRCTDQIIYIQ